METDKLKTIISQCIDKTTNGVMFWRKSYDYTMWDTYETQIESYILRIEDSVIPTFSVVTNEGNILASISSENTIFSSGGIIFIPNSLDDIQQLLALIKSKTLNTDERLDDLIKKLNQSDF